MSPRHGDAETRRVADLCDAAYAASPLTPDERATFGAHLLPPDSYAPTPASSSSASSSPPPAGAAVGATYWADLPFSERMAFVNATSGAEARAEAGAVWAMFRAQPFSPVAAYFRNFVLAGAGLGLESYVLFSIGNLKPLLALAWPGCWAKDDAGRRRRLPRSCTAESVAAVTFLEIVGIMCGQVVVGVVGDWVGRRFCMIQNCVVMLAGLALITASWAGDDNLQAWAWFYGAALLVYGFGVGGEYPITATSAMENAAGEGEVDGRDDRLHRGRRVVLSFLMQGWGQLTNQLALLLWLAVFTAAWGPASADNPAPAQWTFRMSFVPAVLLTAALAWMRLRRMPNAGKVLDEAKARSGVRGYDVRAVRLCLRYFAPRLVGTSGTWFCNDVFFYGNKLFQAEFIRAVTDAHHADVGAIWRWNVVNICVSMAGYYLAALLVDHKFVGRKRMQQAGFLACFVCFLVPASNLDWSRSPGVGIRTFMACYFLSSFFNQFGPNSVTFLVAGELFPTQVRASAHGLAACIGKAGALLPAVAVHFVPFSTTLWVLISFAFLGLVLNALFVPDTTGLDLSEQERRWAYVCAGIPNAYHGVAVHPRHLSLWERRVGRWADSYDPARDAVDRLVWMRKRWADRTEEGVAAAAAADNNNSNGNNNNNNNNATEKVAQQPIPLFSYEIDAYFAAGNRAPLGGEKAVTLPEPAATVSSSSSRSSS